MFVETKRDGEPQAPGDSRVDRILAVATYIETGRGEFSMADPDYCIAAYAVRLYGGRCQFWGSDARRVLGLTWLDSMKLFLPLKKARELTRTRAACVLRHLATTGKVDWNIA